ncbi:MAG: class I SAM-dependent methyltransferase [Planctomycetaceae bacterium]|nr:class I SAM-dependent methyltransferase [Planctomycetaceae bacterium]
MSSSATEATFSTSATSRNSNFSRSLVRKYLAGLRQGQIELLECSGQRELLGSPAEDGLRVELTVHQPDFYSSLIRRSELGLAESRMRGDWSSSDLTTLLRILYRNSAARGGMRSLTGFISQLLDRGRHWLARNSLRGSQRNIAAHYDLGNEFFSLFLDPTMMYSSAVFDAEHPTLEQAAVHKLDCICRKLNLQPRHHVMEIGTGWGGFALHAAQNYGCRVTSTTISRRQFELASRRIRDAGLEDRVTLLLQDYRTLSGTYDRLVSIEMIEAVGHDYLPVYFETCGRLLSPGGRMLVQAITMPDQRYDSYRQSIDFIRRYIFPGGHLPSMTAMQQATARRTDLLLTAVEQFPDSYARTLREWRSRFMSRLGEVREQGFDERFIRMWEYYFCYCEAAFLEQAVGVAHLIWERPGGPREGAGCETA